MKTHYRKDLKVFNLFIRFWRQPKPTVRKRKLDIKRIPAQKEG